ncbi:MAG TPA: hypothetical protein VGS19_29025 [Streptosporangiaceae bacterium]|nr:hypothetical protein [Streptosporangiaceae bacterium]
MAEIILTPAEAALEVIRERGDSDAGVTLGLVANLLAGYLTARRGDDGELLFSMTRAGRAYVEAMPGGAGED